MAITPTIISPGVEILERDQSTRAAQSAGTSVFIPIFSQQGPTSEVTSVSTISEYVEIFGEPVTSSERYSYATVDAALNSAAYVSVSRLPYGVDLGDTKSASVSILAYPALGYAIDSEEVYNEATPEQRIDTSVQLYTKVTRSTSYTPVSVDIAAKVQVQYYTDQAGTPLTDFTNKVTIYTKNGTEYTEVTDVSTQNAVFTTYYVQSANNSFKPITNYSDGSAGIKGEYEDSATFLIGEPVQFNISIEQYYRFLNGQALDGSGEFNWSDAIPQTISTQLADLGQFAFLALNFGKTVTNDLFEGFYLALSDNAFSDPGTSYAAVRKLKTVTQLPASIEEGLTGLQYTTVPNERLDFKLSSPLKGCISQVMEESITDFDISGAQWNDTLNVGVFKVRQATNSGDALKLSALITQGYNASLEYGRQTTSKYTTSAVDFFIENTTANDTLVRMFVNPNFSGALNSRGLYVDGSPKIKVRVYAQQLLDIALTDDEMAGSIEDIMASPAGISKAVLQSIPTDYPTFEMGDSMYPLGLYARSNNASKIIGNLPKKIEAALELVENEELYDVDLLLEGGMGTIYVGAMDAAYRSYEEKLQAAVKADIDRGDDQTTEQDKVKEQYPNGYDPEAALFDDTKVIQGVTDMRTGKSTLSSAAEQVIANHRAIQSAFLKLASAQQEGGRGDVFFIGDTIRQISVEGKDNKIEKQFGMPLVNAAYTALDNVKHSFSTSIYWPNRHLYDGLASSYMAVYPYFLKVQDPVNSTQFWAPASGFVAQKIAATDALYGPWQAAAGMNNGVLSSVLDISFSTQQKQRDDLYRISLNPIIVSPSSGTMLYGIRTMIKRDSALDQISARRTMLYILKLLRDTAKQWLFEGNTLYTRLNVTNVLTPAFDALQEQRAIYSYVLVCDERNNTETEIDAGVMRISAYAAPTRSAERILIDLTASRSGVISTEFSA